MLPVYQDVLRLGQERPSAVFLDFACGSGNDVGKVILDGYPVQNCIATDLRRGLWDFGHEPFRSNQDGFPIPFIEGDIFDDFFIADLPILPADTSPATSRPKDLHSLSSLKPLRGHVSALFAGAFFHLFDEENQARAARKLASLLSPESGSMIAGEQASLFKRGIRQPDPKYPMFCHSPVTWRGIWQDIFGSERIEVRLRMRVQDGGPDFFGQYPGNKTTL